MEVEVTKNQPRNEEIGERREEREEEKKPTLGNKN